MFRSSSRTDVLTLRRLVLVVEDDPAIRTLACRTLQLVGHEALGVGSVQEALRELRCRSWDVVLCDLSLGSGSGVTLVRAMQDDALTCDIPVVLVSGSQHAAQPEVWQRLGFAGFVSKPFKLDHLTAAIEHALSDRATGVRRIVR
jgi:CheY-like chemotaxis protein